MSSKDNLNTAKEKIKDEIKKQGLNFVWKKIESPLLPITKEMTKNGFKVDKKKLQKLSTTFKTKTKKIEEKIFKLSGQEFNIKSTQQLSKILFEKLGISSKGLKKTPKGVISTRESELFKLKGNHKIIDLILEYRELNKMVSTYIDNIIPILDSNDRLHPEFLQLGTSTGRMSSKNPNIQNIPVGGTYGSKIREVFISEKGFFLASFDYSQIELRVAALMSQDKKMITFFKNGKDIHSAVAKEIFGEENKETRRKAKVINFGILYGMGINSLRKNLNSGVNEEISIKEAREYLDNYFDKFNDLASFIEQVKNNVRENGYSETLFGRKRFFPEINSKVPFIRAMAERMAVNAPIQGTAADIIKLAMIEINKYIKEQKLSKKVKLIAQVHDELIFEIKNEIPKKILQDIEKIMEDVLKNSDLDKKYKKVPLEVHACFGENWAELK